MILKEDEILFTEGSPGDSMYVVRSGSLEMRKREGEKNVSLGEIGAGAIIGEHSFFETLPNPYTLQALEETELMVINRQEFDETLESYPAWLRPVLQTLSQRNREAREREEQTQILRALPAALFLMERHLQKSENRTLDLNLILSGIEQINGLSYSQSLRLIKALAALQLFEIVQTQIRVPHPNVISLLYQTLFLRATQHEYPATLLSAGEQLLLSAFIEAAPKNKDAAGGECSVSSEDFLAAHQKMMSGVRFNKHSFMALVRKKYLSTEPAFDAAMPVESIRFFQGNPDFIRGLLELNRIYPLLDKELPQKL
ncbi:MAG: cyclic nucleotide-binding domain-containing protein [Fibrobacter sp.]|jgi:CRP-like cAMP-binding protein|nr:cyclic nucleotide-binding domain-containing protein [Fibrobacter sp.]